MMLTHSSRTQSKTSSPIPILPKGKGRRNVPSSIGTPPKSSSLSVTSNGKSSFGKSSFEYYYQEQHGSQSTSSTPTRASMLSIDTYDLDDRDRYEQEDEQDDFCLVSCNDVTQYLTSSRVHLVNGLNVDNSVTQSDVFYVLCDCPKIKTPTNYLSYSLLETKKGVLAFTTELYATVLKEHLSLNYYIVKMTKDELIYYTEALKTNAAILYNSYTDIDVKSSYFLYFMM